MFPKRVFTGSDFSQSAFLFARFHSIFGRLCLLGVLATLELLVCFPGEDLLFRHQRFYLIPMVVCGAFLSLGYSQLKKQAESIPFGRVLFAGHILCIGTVFCSTLAAIHERRWLFSDSSGYPKSFVFLLGTLLLALACLPFQIWIRTIRLTSPLWFYAALAGVAAWASGFPIRLLWMTSSRGAGKVLQLSTFHAIELILRFFLPGFISDDAAFTLGTPRFLVDIVPQCSGVEGLGLVLVFTSIWLLYFRNECRFPQALLLIPCAIGCIWLLNIARISALIFIGNAGNSEVALVGFHSHAGWIAFIVVASAFSLATQRLSWVRKSSASVALPDGNPRVGGIEAAAEALGSVSDQHGESPAIRPYLVPFLAILAAAFISKAASGYFEWLYPLRFFAGAFVLIYFWPELKKLNWRLSWFAPVAGVVVFLLWIAPSAIARIGGSHPLTVSPIGPALAALSPLARWSWIAFRVAAAVITVPIAEELAFRGYLARRFISRDFDQISFTALTALSIALSSLAFGLMHGQHWIVGTLAGLAYAAALRWRGRIGDAIVAHAVSNLLLAAWVLTLGDWAQW